MPPRRTRKPTRPVTITLDGKPVVAEDGAPLVAALVGAGHVALARSSKFHRPRGPCCLRGGCDGCLMRVDGVPNVMTCGVPAREGTSVERQNVVGVGEVDLMRATDWFFPKGINHHELLTGIPGVQKMMISLARRVSGLGDLPDEARPLRDSIETRSVDVLVVGAGPAGLSAARELAHRGLSVLLVDEQPEAGGGLLAFPEGATLGDEEVEPARAALARGARAAGVELLLGATAFGVLEGLDWLVHVPSRGVLRVEARAYVVASGAHDAAPAFAGNEIPGVYSARAAARLLREGVLVGDAVLLAGEGPYARAFAAAATREGARVTTMALDDLIEAHGMSAVKGATVRTPLGREQRIECDAVVVDGPPAPAFELAAEAAARVGPAGSGFAPRVDEDLAIVTKREIARPAFAIGEVLAAPLDLARFEADAKRLAARLHATIAGATSPRGG